MGIIRDLWEYCDKHSEEKRSKLIYLDDWLDENPQYKQSSEIDNHGKEKPKSMTFDNEE